MTSSTVLESLWEPIFRTYLLLVAPVAQIVDIFDVSVQARQMARLASVEEQRSAAEAEPAEGGRRLRPSSERISITWLARPSTS